MGIISWPNRKFAFASRLTIIVCSISRRNASSKRPSAPARPWSARCRYPRSIEKFTVRRGAFIDKDSHEHFEIRTHKRLIDVVDPDSKTIDTLMRLNLPAGVDIEINL